MKRSDIGITDEVFTHLDDEDGHQTSYAVRQLFERCLAGDIDKFMVPVEEAHAHFCVTNRGVEQERIDELMKNLDYLKKPIMFVALPDGKHLLVDGTHRYVCYFAMKIPHIAAYIIPWEIAKEFVIDDVPQTTEAQLMQHSHIATIRKVFGYSEREGGDGDDDESTRRT